MHHDMLMPYYPTPEEEQEDIGWVFVKARELSLGRVQSDECQTEMTIPPHMDTPGDNVLEQMAQARRELEAARGVELQPQDGQQDDVQDEETQRHVPITCSR